MTQRPDLQPKAAQTPAARGSAPTEAQDVIGDGATAELLQRKYGNFATGVMLGTNAPPPPTDGRAAIQAIVQRHPIKDGVHTAHKGKDKAHTDGEEEAAFTKAKETWEGIEARLQDDQLPKKSTETAALAPGAESAQKIIQLQFDISSASQNKKRLPQIRTYLQKIQGRVGKIATLSGSQAKSEEYSAASLAAGRLPNLLARIEANALTGAQLAKQVVTAPSTIAAEKMLSVAQRDLDVAEEQWKILLDVEARVVAHADLAESAAIYKATANVALQGLRAALVAVKRMVDTRRSVDAARAAKADAIAKAQEEVRRAQEDLDNLREYLREEEAFSAEFLADLGGVVTSGSSTPSSVATMRLAHLQHLQEVRNSIPEAEAELRDAQDALARVPGEQDVLIGDAENQAVLANLGVAGVQDAETTRITGRQELRELAGSERELAQLEISITDATKLKGLLKALGPNLLNRWIKDVGIGPVKAVALYDALGMDPLKAFVSAVGNGWIDTLVSTLSVSDMLDLADDSKLGTKTLGELVPRFGVPELVKLITGITLAKVKLLTDSFTAAELGKSKLNVDALIDLHTKFTAIKLKHWFTTFGQESILDFLTKFTADTLNTFITDVGEPRFEVLVRDKKLKADALSHYGAPFLKDFVGVNAGSMNHLTSAHTKADGTISGGHTVAVFTGELNRIIRPAVLAPPDQARPAQKNGEITAELGLTTDYRKVSYRTFYQNGADRGAGSKTLILTLPTQPATWQRRGNEAVWASIRALQCAAGDAGWNGNSDDGFAFRGFLSPDAKSVATFYPV